MITETDNKRIGQRVNVSISASCRQGGSIAPCDIVDLSPQGVGVRVKSLLVPGDVIDIIIGDKELTAKVVQAKGNLIRLNFQQLTLEKQSFVKWLCRKNQVY